jgi:hypothetical protein
VSEQPNVVGDESGALDSEPSVVTDEDRMGADPLEDGMDTPEGWSRDIRLGGTRENEETDTLTERIPQEEPDVGAAEVDEMPGRPVAATPAMDLDETVDDPEHAIDGVGGVGVVDPLSVDGAPADELLTEGDGEVQLGVDSAVGSVEPGGLPTDDSIGEAVAVENEYPTEGAESEALHVEQER